MSPPICRYSFVVATRERPQRLARCLAAIDRVAYPRERFEVVVVDDGSRTALDRAVAQRAGVRLILQRHQGPGVARNLGARHAAGAYLVFTDDDCEVDPDILRVLDDAFAAAPAAMIGGRTENVLTHNPFSVASQAVVDMVYDYYDGDYDGRHLAPLVTSNNMAVPRRAFLDIGGFNPRMVVASEDRELCEAWVARGLRVVTVPRTTVRHAHDLSLGSYLRQHFAYGRGGRSLHVHGRGGLPRRVGIHWGFYTLDRWVRYPYSCGAGWQKPVVVLAVWLGHAAEFLGYVAERARPASVDV